MSSLLRVKPHTVGVDAAVISKFVQQAGERFGIHGFMLVRHGSVAAEGYWNPYHQENTHVLFSMSKTFTATAIGFAVQEGLLTVEHKVVSFFEDLLPCSPCENMQKMEVRHLLNMATGHSVEPDVMLPEGNWVYNFLTSYVDQEPGSLWCYNTPATYMLSAIIQKVTGMTVYDYLTPRLFEPLGFEKHWWERCPNGITTGGFGFNVRLEDLAKFGQLYLNRGCWQGKQLLDPAWVEALSYNRISNAHSGGHLQSKCGYGYQIWRCSPEGVYRGDGAFGQYCVIMPKQDAVLTVFSGEDQMHEIISLFFDLVLPTLSEQVEEDYIAEEALKRQCNTLQIAPPNGIKVGIGQQKYQNHRYVFPENPLQLELLSIDFDAYRIHMVLEGQVLNLPIGYQEWCESETAVKRLEQHSAFGRVFTNVAVAGAWKANIFTVKVAYNQTPFIDTFKMIFDEKGVIVKYERNVSFMPREYELYGREVE